MTACRSGEGSPDEAQDHRRRRPPAVRPASASRAHRAPRSRPRRHGRRRDAHRRRPRGRGLLLRVRRAPRALAELVEDLAETYVGRAPAPQARHAEAWRALNFIGHPAPSLIALAALDTACWDLACARPRASAPRATAR